MTTSYNSSTSKNRQINKQEAIIFMENQILIELPSSAAAVAI